MNEHTSRKNLHHIIGNGHYKKIFIFRLRSPKRPQLNIIFKNENSIFEFWLSQLIISINFLGELTGDKTHFKTGNGKLE